MIKMPHVCALASALMPTHLTDTVVAFVDSPSGNIRPRD